jgi:hypothetical protein
VSIAIGCVGLVGGISGFANAGTLAVIGAVVATTSRVGSLVTETGVFRDATPALQIAFAVGGLAGSGAMAAGNLALGAARAATTAARAAEAMLRGMATVAQGAGAAAQGVGTVGRSAATLQADLATVEAREHGDAREQLRARNDDTLDAMRALRACYERSMQRAEDIRDTQQEARRAMARNLLRG